MQRVLIISRYLKKTKDGHEFHFKGYYKGLKIKGIRVDSGSFVRGEDYVLSLDMQKVEAELLYGRLIKFRKL